MYKKTLSKYSEETDLFVVKVKEEKSIIMAKHICSYLPLESYEVGEEKDITISLRHYILEHV